MSVLTGSADPAVARQLHAQEKRIQELESTLKLQTQQNRIADLEAQLTQALAVNTSTSVTLHESELAPAQPQPPAEQLNVDATQTPPTDSSIHTAAADANRGDVGAVGTSTATTAEPSRTSVVSDTTTATAAAKDHAKAEAERQQKEAEVAERAEERQAQETKEERQRTKEAAELERKTQEETERRRKQQNATERERQAQEEAQEEAERQRNAPEAASTAAATVTKTVTLQRPNDACRFGIEFACTPDLEYGVAVHVVETQSLAAEAGVDEDSQVVSINGTSCRGFGAKELVGVLAVVGNTLTVELVALERPHDTAPTVTRTVALQRPNDACGFGIEFACTPDMESGVTVHVVETQSLAAEAGVDEDSQVVTINGTSCRGFGVKELMSVLEGASNTLTVELSESDRSINTVFERDGSINTTQAANALFGNILVVPPAGGARSTAAWDQVANNKDTSASYDVTVGVDKVGHEFVYCGATDEQDATANRAGVFISHARAKSEHRKALHKQVVSANGADIQTLADLAAVLSKALTQTPNVVKLHLAPNPELVGSFTDAATAGETPLEIKVPLGEEGHEFVYCGATDAADAEANRAGVFIAGVREDSQHPEAQHKQVLSANGVDMKERTLADMTDVMIKASQQDPSELTLRLAANPSLVIAFAGFVGTENSHVLVSSARDEVGGVGFELGSDAAGNTVAAS